MHTMIIVILWDVYKKVRKLEIEAFVLVGECSILCLKTCTTTKYLVLVTCLSMIFFPKICTGGGCHSNRMTNTKGRIIGFASNHIMHHSSIGWGLFKSQVGITLQHEDKCVRVPFDNAKEEPS